ncbi:YlbG family protein [Vagococcus xieshaowenii]|uniref:DUF2129 domain-containing protein n=1 Tax=Vagococcus xieshaowenii TaxID=2562451 RepID=A0AAJ5JQW6_9ENTE|nr:YlbG family protein [Vagococcus xieshaowenii]QCA28376.1 DUF2129 domain-containing protein [Vagococcus xieshaowenii]TFZ42867.1 DUF2129 domain-containing protein [Vagococcus xieshaowenii]
MLDENQLTEEIIQETLPWKKRRSLTVWVYTMRPLRQLRKFGLVHHVSKKMKYVVIYMDDVDIPKNKEAIESLHFVRKVDVSYRPDVSTTYSKNEDADDGFEVQELGTTIKLAEIV